MGLFVEKVLVDRVDLELPDPQLQRLALGLQASVVARNAPGFVADAFCRSRLESRGAHHYGTLPRGADAAAIVERAAAR